MGQYLPNEVAHASPTFIIGMDLAHVGGLVKLSHLSWNAGVSCKIGPHICGSWYFPKFLLSEGSFTQIYIVSFMFLVTPCDSLSTLVKHSGLLGVLQSSYGGE